MNHKHNIRPTASPEPDSPDPASRSRRAGETGSVLMETVIAIPLFLVLIGGLFWLGELTLARHRLTASDRFAAWNIGNRHLEGAGSIQPDLEEHMFNPERVGQQTIVSIDYQ